MIVKQREERGNERGGMMKVETNLYSCGLWAVADGRSDAVVPLSSEHASAHTLHQGSKF